MIYGRLSILKLRVINALAEEVGLGRIGEPLQHAGVLLNKTTAKTQGF
jgi:hypothetical protein